MTTSIFERLSWHLKERLFAPVQISVTVQRSTRRAVGPTSLVRALRPFTLRAIDCSVPESQLSRRYMGPPLAAGSGLLWLLTSAWPVRRRASAPTSHDLVFILASVLPSRCRR